MSDRAASKTQPDPELLDDAVDARDRKDEALEDYRQAVADAYSGGHTPYAIAKKLGVELRSVLGMLDRLGAR